MFSLGKWITQKFTDWLTYEAKCPGSAPPLTNYERLCDEFRPGDTILAKGRSPVATKVAEGLFSYVHIDEQDKPAAIYVKDI